MTWLLTYRWFVKRPSSPWLQAVALHSAQTKLGQLRWGPMRWDEFPLEEILVVIIRLLIYHGCDVCREAGHVTSVGESARPARTSWWFYRTWTTYSSRPATTTTRILSGPFSVPYFNISWPTDYLVLCRTYYNCPLSHYSQPWPTTVTNVRAILAYNIII